MVKRTITIKRAQSNKAVACLINGAIKQRIYNASNGFVTKSK